MRQGPHDAEHGKYKEIRSASTQFRFSHDSVGKESANGIEFTIMRILDVCDSLRVRVVAVGR